MSYRNSVEISHYRVSSLASCWSTSQSKARSPNIVKLTLEDSVWLTLTPWFLQEEGMKKFCDGEKSFLDFMSAFRL